MLRGRPFFEINTKSKSCSRILPCILNGAFKNYKDKERAFCLLCSLLPSALLSFLGTPLGTHLCTSLPLQQRGPLLLVVILPRR